MTTMPRSGDEILADADQLAGRFEDYDPEPGDELNREAVTALRAAVQERSDESRPGRGAGRASGGTAFVGDRRARRNRWRGSPPALWPGDRLTGFLAARRVLGDALEASSRTQS